MTEVYGTAFVETARDYLVALLEALKTSMSAYSPTFSYVYEKHNQADLRLNAVSVGLERADTKPFGTANHDYVLVFSVRVHTAYADGFADGLTVERLLNSIANKFTENYELGGNYRLSAVDELTANRSFEESATKGGQLLVTVSTQA